MVQVCIKAEGDRRVEALKLRPSNTASGAWGRRVFENDWSYLQWNAPDELPAIPYWVPPFL